MSKIFSMVELEANTGITYSGYMSGMPDREDVENSDLYQELFGGLRWYRIDKGLCEFLHLR